MPFIGYVVDDDESSSTGEREVFPDEIDDADAVACVSCDEPMYTRRGHWREDETVWVSRHFVHRGGGGGAGGDRECAGESDAHKRMKYVASQAIPRRIENATEIEIASSEREATVPGTNRRADVLITFDEPAIPHGHGVAVEIQYRHDDKDVETVEREYLAAGYSVAWLDESHFNDRHTELVEPADPIPVWPNAMPRPHWRSEVFDEYGWGEYRDFQAGWREQVGHKIMRAMEPPDFEFRGFDEPVVPATIPGDYFEERTDEIHAVWHAAWTDTLADSISDAIDDADDTTHHDLLDDVRRNPLTAVEATIPLGELLRSGVLKPAWRRGVRSRSSMFDRRAGPSDPPNRPPNPFDDVQCWTCGRYWHASKGRDACRRCGEPVDWDWNVDTGRVGAEARPDRDGR